jgi:hypothetical protein
MRNGALRDARFGARMVGTGARWQAIEQLFAMHCRRLGLAVGGPDPALARATQTPPRQLRLFD